MHDIRRASLERRLAILCARNAKTLDAAELALANPEAISTLRMEPIVLDDAHELTAIVDELEALRRGEVT